MRAGLTILFALAVVLPLPALAKEMVCTAKVSKDVFSNSRELLVKTYVYRGRSVDPERSRREHEEVAKRGIVYHCIQVNVDNPAYTINKEKGAKLLVENCTSALQRIRKQCAFISP